MEMFYVSTRGGAEKVRAAQAIKQGIAGNGGLFMPAALPKISEEDLQAFIQMSYPQRAAHILSLFLDDYSYDELFKDCTEAYSEQRFPGGPAPVTDYSDSIKMLELWHGPTCAFKDMALQMHARICSPRFGKDKTRERTVLILVATSGDTGKAALEGFADVDGRRKFTVFYPEDGRFSHRRSGKWLRSAGDNVGVLCAIQGNFDDCADRRQSKYLPIQPFNEKLNQNGFNLSSANSINWGRLRPQIVYYISAYCDMVKRGDIQMGEEIAVVRAHRQLRQHFRRLYR